MLALRASVLLLLALKCGAISWTTPSPSMELRLVGGASPSEGRLEIFHSYRWGTVCDDDWDADDAAVACRQLGFGGGGSAVVTSLYWESGAGDPPHDILLDNVECAGTEARLAECPHRGWGVNNCNHVEDVAIRCGYSDTHEAEPMPIRLAGWSSDSGRLEVYLDGTWGTVCDEYWGHDDALVACRQLGFSAVAPGSPPAVDSLAADAAGPVHLYSVACRGSEAHLGDCVHTGHGDPMEGYCGHERDVTLACESSDTTEFSLRLSDGPHPAEGRLEVRWSGQWATVCDDYWDEQDAAVACRQLGLGGPTSPSSPALVPPGTGAIALDDVTCQGWESRLVDCGHLALGTHNCDHHEDVIMACTGTSDGFAVYPSPDGFLYRLVDGWSHYEGRVEIYHQGVAAGVCDTDWTERDAAVVCRGLGFGTPIRPVQPATFGWSSPTDFSWLNNVSCAGHEAALHECSGGGGQSARLQFCRGMDAGVACTGPYQGSEEEMRNAAVRLEGGEGDAEGRVEIFMDGEWSTVCNWDWDINDAHVVCRQLGFHDVDYEWHYVDWLPMATGPILLSGVRCQGDETTIMGCRHNGLYTHECTHSDDVVISCRTGFPGFGPSRVLGGLAAAAFILTAAVFGIRRKMLLQRERNRVGVPSGREHGAADPAQPPPPPGSYPVHITTTMQLQSQPAHLQPPQPAATPLQYALKAPPQGDVTASRGPPPPPLQTHPQPQPQPQLQPRPPSSPAAAPPAMLYPDPNPLPPSYLAATQGADGVNPLPVYLPAPVAAQNALPPVGDVAHHQPMSSRQNPATFRN